MDRVGYNVSTIEGVIKILKKNIKFYDLIYNPFVNPVHGGLSTKIRKDIPHKKHKKHWISFFGTRSLFGTTPETAVSVETQTKLRFFSETWLKLARTVNTRWHGCR